MSFLNLPWIIIGYFNVVVSIREHKGGHHSYYSQKACLFANFIVLHDLLDIGYIGSYYTWYNSNKWPNSVLGQIRLVLGESSLVF